MPKSCNLSWSNKPRRYLNGQTTKQDEAEFQITFTESERRDARSSLGDAIGFTSDEDFERLNDSQVLLHGMPPRGTVSKEALDFKSTLSNHFHLISYENAISPVLVSMNTLRLIEKPTSIAHLLEFHDGALTAAKLAVIVGMSRTTVYEMTSSGQVPYYRIGTKIRYDGVEVADWWRSLAIPAAA